VQSIMTDIIPRRLGTAINTFLTNGTGTNQPYGLTTTVTNSALTTAGATAITQAELMRVVYSIDRAYRDNASWMMSDTILGYIRTLELGNTNTIPIFTPNGDVVGQEPIRLMGFPIYINNDLPAANASTRVPVTATKSLYFGDMSKYKVRRIGGVNMSRNDTLYWENRSVGFRAFQRIDGNLVNANAIKYLLQG
jgi:HK97 family phage major capsid protein